MLRHLLRHGLQVVLADTVVAVIIATLRGGDFGSIFAHSQAIGLFSWGFIESGRMLLLGGALEGWPRGWKGLALVVAGCTAGFLAGTTVADALPGRPGWKATFASPRALMADIALTATFSTIIVGWFYTRGRALVQRSQVAAATHEATLARLVLLQSQLEPHMLFNTLANLRALIAADPERAQAMLDRLIDFLRATLDASRVTAHPLADEFLRIADYLALMQVRMGDRLRTITSLPPELAGIAVPPLLLQPLVENAIKHGLEPQRGAGDLRVSAVRDGAMLVLAVTDSGRGLDAAAAANARDPATAGAGFGLAQIRERLQTLHGDAASFTLSTRPEGGTRAEIRLPLPLTHTA